MQILSLEDKEMICRTDGGGRQREVGEECYTLVLQKHSLFFLSKHHIDLFSHNSSLTQNKQMIYFTLHDFPQARRAEEMCRASVVRQRQVECVCEGRQSQGQVRASEGTCLSHVRSHCTAKHRFFTHNFLKAATIKNFLLLSGGF